MFYMKPCCYPSTHPQTKLTAPTTGQLIRQRPPPNADGQSPMSRPPTKLLVPQRRRHRHGLSALPHRAGQSPFTTHQNQLHPSHTHLLTSTVRMRRPLSWASEASCREKKSPSCSSRKPRRSATSRAIPAPTLQISRACWLRSSRRRSMGLMRVGLTFRFWRRGGTPRYGNNIPSYAISLGRKLNE